MTLYRKYRPQLISQLDILDARDKLSKMLSSSYFPHAFLFSGPKGTGKTSAARIVAKVLNCEKNNFSPINTGSDFDMDKKKGPIPDPEPCNDCDSCLSITQGQHLDVIEIDAASNRGIEEIRDLREKIKLAPVGARYKVYIIDEVHMMTNEAFNALLKTLEEPPKHAVFILATTEPEKLPATILSRCTKINFHQAKDAEIVNCLKRVSKGEKLDLPQEFLFSIAAFADGSFRDATKILEQAILEKALTQEKLNKMLGQESTLVKNLLLILAKKETRTALELICDKTYEGVNFRSFVTDILYLLHDLLLARHGIKKEKIDSQLLEVFTTQEVLDLIKLFSRVYAELRQTNLPFLPIQVAIVQWCERK